MFLGFGGEQTLWFCPDICKEQRPRVKHAALAEVSALYWKSLICLSSYPENAVAVAEIILI